MRTLKDVSREVKEQADIVAIIGRYVPLKKNGATYKGLCPFHVEKTPSFNVVPNRGIFHCFGCGQGGSVIDFVMKADKLEFVEALKQLAGELGIQVPERSGVDASERALEESRRRDVQSANDHALKYFRKVLEKRGNPLANDYLPKRGLTPEIVEKFQLGASPNEWSAMTDAMRRDGFSEELLVEAALSVRSEKGRLYDRFRHRLIFPILDHQGRVIGFGGRRLDDDPQSPKYLNSAETSLYKKGNSLYALNIAKQSIQDSGYVILTEGYVDTIMAHHHGFTQAVASLGTALTPEQARLLKRFASRTYFLYDGDSAGQKAMLRGGESLMRAGFDTRVIALPAEDDPDTFLIREGADALRARMEGAREYFDFAIDSVSADLDLSSIAGQSQLAERLIPVLKSMANDVQREAGIVRLLRSAGGLPRQAVEKMLSTPERRVQEAPESPPGEAEELPPPDPLEKFLLKLMLESPEALTIVREKLHIDWLRDPQVEPWVHALHDDGRDVKSILEECEATGEWPGNRRLITELLADVQPLGDVKHAARENLARLKRRYHARTQAEELRRVRDIHPDSHDQITRGLQSFEHEGRLRVGTRMPDREG